MGVGYYIGTQGSWGNYFTQNFMVSNSHTEDYPLYGGSHHETDSGDIRFFAQYVGRRRLHHLTQHPTISPPRYHPAAQPPPHPLTPPCVPLGTIRMTPRL